MHTCTCETTHFWKIALLKTFESLFFLLYALSNACINDFHPQTQDVTKHGRLYCCGGNFYSWEASHEGVRRHGRSLQLNLYLASSQVIHINCYCSFTNQQWFLNFMQFCSWRCEARELFTWSAWYSRWEEAISHRSWFRYDFSGFFYHQQLCACTVYFTHICWLELLAITLFVQHLGGKMHHLVSMWIMTRGLTYSGMNFSMSTEWRMLHKF